MLLKKVIFISFFVLTVCGCKTLAQKQVPNTADGKFSDPEIELYSPTFETAKEEPKPEIGTVKKDCKTLPASNAVRLKVITDSITQANKLIKYAVGYRILVYSGINKEEANKAKVALYHLLPNEDNYNVYRQPNYRVLLGNYADRLQAYRTLKLEVSKLFPNAIVIQDNILIKK
ncbi:MAG: hypothetical protein ACKVOU_08600 [Cytophagales bacterium]